MDGVAYAGTECQMRLECKCRMVGRLIQERNRAEQKASDLSAELIEVRQENADLRGQLARWREYGRPD